VGVFLKKKVVIKTERLGYFDVITPSSDRFQDAGVNVSTYVAFLSFFFFFLENYSDLKCMKRFKSLVPNGTQAPWLGKEIILLRTSGR
jgi:hypothetical protein